MQEHTIVILDGYTENPGDLSWDGFAALGKLVVYDRTEPQMILSRIDTADIVITNKTPLSRSTLEQAPNLRYVGVLATGYNVVDVEAAKELKIAVTNIPGYGTEAVAQYTFAHLLEIASRVQSHSDAVHARRWASCPDFCFWDHPLMELSGKTMGIIGYGRIGQATARLARAFGMQVIAYSSTHHPTHASVYVDLDTLLQKSDIVSLHCPLLPTTAGIINKNTIAKMKDGVILLNTNRGGLVVEEDLAAALNSGKVMAAGLDVVSSEPIKKDNPLLDAKNCWITPHISWASKESRIRLMETAVDNLSKFLAGTMQHVVNPWW